MSPFWVVLALSGAGGLGAVARFVLDAAVKTRFVSGFPLGTMIINVTGSLLLGFVTAVAGAHLLSPAWSIILGTGFLGGYTTFSTASFETVRLMQERRWIPAALSGFGMLLLTVAAAGLGLWLGGRL